jgi:hypothetical protein
MEVEKKKLQTILLGGSSDQDHYTHTDPTWTWTLEKNVTWDRVAPKNVTWSREAPKNVI